MPALPTPLRAALGLAVTVLDEARHLPDKAIELPMLAVSTALKISLRAQQRYTALASRGDEVLSGRSVTDAPPAWATFDEPAFDEPAFDEPADDERADDVEIDEVIVEEIADEVGPDEPAPARKTAPRKRTAKTVNAPRTGARSAFDDATSGFSGDKAMFDDATSAFDTSHDSTAPDSTTDNGPAGADG